MATPRRSLQQASAIALLLVGCGSSSGDAVPDGGAKDASLKDATSRDSGGKDTGANDTGARDAVSDVSAKDARIDAKEAGPRTIDKVDVLFVVSNVASMAAEQQALAASAGALVGRLANPFCVDGSGTPAATQPTGPSGACAAGTTREFPPVADMHIGVISSSLGTYGANGCVESDTASCSNGGTNTSQDDHAHLLTRADPCGSSVVPTYQSLGFLAWDPNGKLSPPGESQLGSPTSPGLLQSLDDIIVGVGSLGCGFEAPLEAWYRFLVDPTPYASISLNGQTATATGTDTALLTQRGAFLRASSLLLVVMLNDKDDCSIQASSFYPLLAQVSDNGTPFHLPSATSVCATNPADPCCYSCGQAPPTGCTADPACTTTPILTAALDAPTLRCFNDKQRFGIDFLYPIDRYTAGLTASTVPNAEGMMVANPVFAPNGSDTDVRDADMVYFASWSGVPWQDISRSPTDITQGLKNDVELAATSDGGASAWDEIVGDPASFVAPKDPYMVPSSSPRTGTDPITGTTLAPPTAPNGTNPINGHEYSKDSAGEAMGTPDNLEYASIFPLDVPIDCSAPLASCACTYATNDQPICDPNPNDSGNATLQTSAAVSPGVRSLAVVKGLGAQGVAGSAAWVQTTNPAGADYAYVQNANAVIARIGPLLAQ